MKAQLKTIYEKNQKWFEVWVYLWLKSDNKNTIVFSYSDLGARFNIPKTTIHRIISFYKTLNETKQFIELNSTIDNKIELKFYPTGKVENKETPLIEALYLFLLNFYQEHDYDYPELKKHKNHIKTIANKLNKFLVEKKKENISEAELIDTFKIFFINIPNWWKQNAFTLPTISKNFNKILNQIKISSNGKNTKYDNANKEIRNLDFEKISKARN